MTITKTCRCGNPMPCLTHERKRPTTTQRGLGAKHQARRRTLIKAAVGQTCPLCLKPMLAGQELDLDHSPRADRRGPGDRITHATCNRAAGNHRSRSARAS